MFIILGQQLYSANNKMILCSIYFLGEVSSIFLFWYENFSFYKSTQALSKVFGFTFCFIFLMARVVTATPLYFLVQLHPKVNVVFKVALMFGAYISWVWGW